MPFIANPGDCLPISPTFTAEQRTDRRNTAVRRRSSRCAVSCCCLYAIMTALTDYSFDEEFGFRLQLEEITIFESTSKGKNRADQPHPSSSAYKLYVDEVEALLGRLDSERLATSMAEAVRSDGEEVERLAMEELRAINDRRMAITLGGKNPNSAEFVNSYPTPPPTFYSRSASVVSAFHEEATAASMKPVPLTTVFQSAEGKEAHTHHEEVGESSHGSERVSCVICFDTYPASKAFRTPCGHYYDFECMKELFIKATDDETLMPPKCCQKYIPLSVGDRILSTKERARFEARRLEFATVDKLYCTHPTCSTFVPPQMIQGDVAACPACNTKICTRCKGTAHTNSDCPQDPSTQLTLDLAQSEGWRQCTSCHTMVQLGEGCFHITCRCRAEWCYLCGEKWKRCTCPQWDERYLYRRAALQVDRQAPVLPALVRERRVQTVAAALREDHECAHDSWRLRQGGGACDHCGDHLPRYLLRCEGCQILACVPCQRNRLPPYSASPSSPAHASYRLSNPARSSLTGFNQTLPDQATSTPLNPSDLSTLHRPLYTVQSPLSSPGIFTFPSQFEAITSVMIATLAPPPPPPYCSDIGQIDRHNLIVALCLYFGMIISYLPQHYRIISRKSSEGISPWFLLLGVTSGTCATLNIVVLQSKVVGCCQFLSFGQCFAASLGVVHLCTQMVMFTLILVFFLLYFPRTSPLPLAAISLPTPPSSEYGDAYPAAPERTPLLPSTLKASTTTTSEFRLGIFVALFCFFHFVICAGVSIILVRAYSTHTARLWANYLGLCGAALSAGQYIPQLYRTWRIKQVAALSIPMMMIQTPGGFLFAWSLARRPGTDWSTWCIFAVTAGLQGVLLVMCLCWAWKERTERVRKGKARGRVNGEEEGSDQEERRGVLS
ncbi:hypothetical protein G7K_2120-t1 [Saitoella complicata NRRL Y-17804]|uniref:RBR-type E3 ubiquitin transferase n=1 Tax=Saitoella complicata (strain BCRC 22490 / CBS 7301 / JCM 7358 / NBRC 10748 / NRRL Y-17804) TaxID=698492 RepID=A0A0E9NDL4_SAICN|nr:hypothetical protein G7K_2120-t1 [Saitoella complicata NRRL Y-17804]